MKFKYSFIVILFFSSGLIISQSSLNEYKYIIVPNKYDFLKQEDQYQLNSLTKFLFQKEGFETLFDKDVRPEDLSNNPCLALTSIVKDNSSFLSTKLIIELVNCKNEIVITTIEGRTRTKDYKKAHHEALRKAFNSITLLNYRYEPVKQLDVVETQDEEKIITVPFQLVDDKKKMKEPDEVKKIIEVKEDKVINSVIEPEEKDIKKEVDENEIIELEAPINLLYAQETPNGFQLVDSTPKVVFVLLRSSREGVYILKNKKGILFKNDEQWIVEFYDGNNIVSKELQIKF